MARHARHEGYEASYAKLGVEQTSAQPTQRRGRPTSPAAPAGRTAGARGVVPSDSAGAQAFVAPTPRSHTRSRYVPLLIVAAALLLVYVGGALFFSFAFYPNTVLDGSDVSLKTEREVAQANTESTASAVLTVSLGSDFSGEVLGTSIDLATDGAAYAHSAMQTQSPWLWPFKAFGTHQLSFESQATFDAAKLHEVVVAMVEEHNSTATPSTDATAVYDSTSGSYKIVPATVGTTLNEELVEAQISEALVARQESVELTEECYVQPTLLEDDPTLQEAVAKVNGALSATQELTVDGVQVARVSSQQIGAWVSVGDDLSIAVDVDAIVRWTEGDLSRDLDTVGTRRSYSLPDGTWASVSGGTYGWIINGSETAELIAANLREGKSGSIEVPMRQKAARHAGVGEADWGSRWVDVNLTTQHALLVDNGSVVWESDIVSGAVEGNFETPTGVYAINDNLTCSSVRGSQIKLVSPFTDDHGDPTYVSYVDYWMPFIDDLIAFHDAPWRSEFGGSIYVYDGSHGCINLPVDKAKELYALLSVGDVVVVHS